METGDGGTGDTPSLTAPLIAIALLPDPINSTMKKSKIRIPIRMPAWMRDKSPISLLDGYIIRKFLGTYVFSIALILAIVVMFDINEKLDAFLPVSYTHLTLPTT